MQTDTAQLHAALTGSGIRQYGVCAFQACLPLLPCRAQERLPQTARSVVVCLFPYPVRDYPRRNVARYAVAADYHEVAGRALARACVALERLFPKEEFVWFVDNSPIREVEAARLAGLGVRGDNGLLQCSAYGSDCFIGSIVTSLALAYAVPVEGGCLHCGRCVAACPTGALRAGLPLDRERCRSHITQKKGELSPWEREQVRAGGLVWGCDRCTDACPVNRRVREQGRVPPFGGQEDPLLTRRELERLLQEKAYGYRGKKVLLRNLALLEGAEE